MLWASFWMSAALSFGWVFWPRMTWVVVLAGAAAIAVLGLLHPVPATTAGAALTQVFGTWPQILVCLAGYAWGRLIAMGVRRDWSAKRRAR